MMRQLDKTRTPLRPFRIAIPQAQIDALRARLAQTEHWREAYDWRKHEERLNEFAQFTTTIDGANVHFLHVRSAEPRALPLLVAHGWPGAIVDLAEMIDPLIRPRAYGARAADAFHVVAPSLPGFGFSGPTSGGHWDLERIAKVLAALMTRLGYPRFAVYGRDFGAPVAVELAELAPERVLGVHVHDESAPAAPADRDALLTQQLLCLATGAAAAGTMPSLSLRPDQTVSELRACFRACR